MTAYNPTIVLINADTTRVAKTRVTEHELTARTMYQRHIREIEVWARTLVLVNANETW